MSISDIGVKPQRTVALIGANLNGIDIEGISAAHFKQAIVSGATLHIAAYRRQAQFFRGNHIAFTGQIQHAITAVAR